ncbi:MAG TPA: hypothetical protein VK131_08185 [Candidatus Acidoferrales bacterium]|nr:hypothetical protein [Candidatus Acidoferrales bacterium]
MRGVLAAAALTLLVACGGGPPGPTPAATSTTARQPTTAAAALALLDGSRMRDGHCDQTGTSASANSNGTVVGFCVISRSGSTFSLEQKYSVTVTVSGRTVTAYADSIQIGGDTYYSYGPNPTGGTYTRGTVTPPPGWSELFFAGASFSNLQPETLNGTAVWVVDATTPLAGGVTKTGKLFIRAGDGYLMVVELNTGAGATMLHTKLAFTRWDGGETVSAPH